VSEVSLTKGWKTYLSGATLIALGLWLCSVGREVEGAQSIAMGLGLIGIRHYLEYSQEDKKK
jgi:hypothetical protein